MSTDIHLFDLEAYSEKAPTISPGSRRRPLSMSPNVWLALVSLKATLDEATEKESDSHDGLYRRAANGD